MKFYDVFIILLVIFMWASYYIAIKLGVAGSSPNLGVENFPPLLMGSFRFLFPAIILAPFFRLSKKHLKGVLLFSLAITIEAALSYVGMQHIEGGCATVIYQLVIPFSAILAMIFFKDKLSMEQWFGIIVSFVGIIIIVGSPSVTNMLGVFMLIGATFSFSVSNIVVKKIPAPVSAFMLVGWGAVFCVPQLLLLSFLFEEGQVEALKNASTTTWITIFYLGIVSAIIAQLLWYYLIRKYPVTKVIHFMLLEPAIGLLLAYVALSESLSWQKVLGCAVVIVGMILVEFSARRRKRRST